MRISVGVEWAEWHQTIVAVFFLTLPHTPPLIIVTPVWSKHSFFYLSSLESLTHTFVSSGSSSKKVWKKRRCVSRGSATFLSFFGTILGTWCMKGWVEEVTAFVTICCFFSPCISYLFCSFIIFSLLYILQFVI